MRCRPVTATSRPRIVPLRRRHDRPNQPEAADGRHRVVPVSWLVRGACPPLVPATRRRLMDRIAVWRPYSAAPSLIRPDPVVGHPPATSRTRVRIVEDSEVADWFAEYVSAFAALGRGEARPDDVVLHYGVPFLVTTDDVIIAHRTVQEVAAWLKRQADAMAAAAYDHTKTLASDISILNRNTALLRGEFSRQRSDGTEINQMSVTYVVTRESGSFRISALVLHSACMPRG